MSSAPNTEQRELLEVRLLRLPVALHAKSQEHGAELMREMYLIAQELREDDAPQLPTRLVALVEELGSRFGGVTTEQDRQLEAAIEAGVEELDVIYRVPVEAAEASVRLGAMLDEADEFCSEGQHLLTLATPPDSLAYRRWYLDQFVSQLAGGPATPWPDYTAERRQSPTGE